MNKIFLHIGYPKCASTFLQREIFTKNKDINYLNFNRANKKWVLFWKLLYHVKDDFFIKNYKKDLKFLNKLNFHLINVASSEDITDHVKLKSVYNTNITSIFKRLKIISNHFKIKFKFLITIREQKQLIMSRYAQDNCFIKLIPKYKNFIEIKNFFKIKNKSNLEKEIFDSYDFYNIYKNLNKFFYSVDIKIITIEDLYSKENSSINDLCRFLGTKYIKKYMGEDFIYNASFKNKFSNSYYRKWDNKTNRSKGILNIISTLIPFRKKIFKIINKNLRDKLKIFFLEFDRFFGKYDKIIIYPNEAKYIFKYYKKNNIKLSKIINYDITKYNI